MSIFKSHLYELSAYTPPLEGRDPETHLLLDFNERTLPVSEPIRQALIDYVNSDRIQMYPSYGDIANIIADYAKVKPTQTMITNGSDQGIELIFRASCSPGDEVIIPMPNFAMYQQCAQVERVKIVAPFYSQEHGFPLAEVLAAINEKTRVICISNPNNPSGVGVRPDDIESIAKAAPNSTILVDECYFEFSKLSAVGLLDRHSNIVITRTFSKTWGMPSLRFGYLLASPENIQALLCVRGPYDINQMAIVAARAALENPGYTDAYVDEVMNKSKPLLEKFLTDKGISYWPSCANYLWTFPENIDNLESALTAANILVRPKADASGKMGLRISLGSFAQTKHLIDILTRAL